MKRIFLIGILAMLLSVSWQYSAYAVTSPTFNLDDLEEVEIQPPQQFYFSGCWGGLPCLTTENFTRSFNDAFFLASGAIALSIFVVGAFLMVISAGNDTLLQAAKRAMKGSLIGLALIVGSYGIYRTIVFLVYH